MAIAALVMGALSVGGGFCLCGPLLSVLGVIFGAIGISQVNKNPQTETGKALAVWGLVLSVVGLVFAIAFVIFFIVVGCLEQACVP
jgi:large-conductance mechanosensitive channel